MNLEQYFEQSSNQKLNLIINDLESSTFILQITELYSKPNQLIITSHNNIITIHKNIITTNNNIITYTQLLDHIQLIQQYELIAIDLKHLILDIHFLSALYLVEHLITNNPNTIFDIYVNHSNHDLVKSHLKIQTITYKDELILDIRTIIIQELEPYLQQNNCKEYIKNLIDIIEQQNQFRIHNDVLIILPNNRYLELFKTSYHNSQYQFIDFNSNKSTIQCPNNDHHSKQKMIVVSAEFLQFYDKTVFEQFEIQTVIDCGYFQNICYHKDLDISYPRSELQTFSQKLAKKQLINPKFKNKDYIQLYQTTKFNQQINHCNLHKLMALRTLFVHQNSFVDQILSSSDQQQRTIEKYSKEQIKQFYGLDLSLREFKVYNDLKEQKLQQIYQQMVLLSQKVEINNFREQLNYVNYKDDLQLMVDLLIQFDGRTNSQNGQISQWYFQNNLNSSVHYFLELMFNKNQLLVQKDSKQYYDIDNKQCYKTMVNSITQFSRDVCLQVLSYLNYQIADKEQIYTVDRQSYFGKWYCEQLVALSLERSADDITIVQGLAVQNQNVQIQKSVSIDKEQGLQHIIEFTNIQTKVYFQKQYLQELNQQFGDMIRSDNSQQQYLVVSYKCCQQNVLEKLLKEVESRLQLVNSQMKQGCEFEYLLRNYIVTDGGVINKIMLDRGIIVQNIPLELDELQIKEHFIDFEQICKIEKVQITQVCKNYKNCLVMIENNKHIQDFVDIYRYYEIEDHQIKVGANSLQQGVDKEQDNDQEQNKYILLKTMAYNKQHSQKGLIRFLVQDKNHKLDLQFMRGLKNKYGLSFSFIDKNRDDNDNEVKYRLTKVQKSVDEIKIRRLFDEIYGENEMIRLIDVSLERVNLRASLREKILITLQRYLIRNDRNYKLKYSSYEIEDNDLEKGEIIIQNKEQLDHIEKGLKDIKHMVAQNYLLHLDKVWVLEYRPNYIKKQIFDVEFMKQDMIQQLIANRQLEIVKYIQKETVYKLVCRDAEIFDLVQKIIMSVIRMKPLKINGQQELINFKIEKVIQTVAKNYNFEIEYLNNKVNILGLTKDIESFTESMNNYMQNYDEITISLQNISLQKFHQYSSYKRLLNLQVEKGILDIQYCFQKKTIQFYMFKKTETEKQDIISSVESLLENFKDKETIQSKQEEQQELCELCFDLLDEKYTLINCQHSFCKQCIEFTASVCLKDKSLIPFKCPTCEMPVNPIDIEILIQDSQLDKFYSMSTDIFIQQNSSQYQYCIQKECQSIMYLVEEDYENKFHCNSCAVDYCVKCNVKYHYHQSCDDFKNRTPDKLFMEYAKMYRCKECPKCRFYIFKDGGCNKVTCVHCKINICWVCLMSFKSCQDCYSHIQKNHRLYDQ